MFERRTVIVLGAGASQEFGMPTGYELARSIRQAMDVRFKDGITPVGSGDHQLFAFVRSRFPSSGTLSSAALRIRDGVFHSNSIDDFLDLHRDDPEINLLGKAAIVRCILQAERRSQLWTNPYDGPAFHPDNVAQTWIVRLMRMLTRGMHAADVEQVFRNLTFISFNYDRSLEYFLSNALVNSFGCSVEAAQKIVDRLTIIHPYGIVAPLWGSGRVTPFGSDGSFDWAAQAGDISTYTEQVADAKLVERMRAASADAQQLVFLGFGFHAQNMRLITPEKPGTVVKKVLATAQGMSKSDCQIVESLLTRLQPERAHGVAVTPVVRSDLTCAQLFDEFRLTLPN
jgi:hypothetical protein